MLSFDHLRSCFVLDGVAIGVELRDINQALNVQISQMPGDADWSLLESSRTSLGMFVTFYRLTMHSGFFWVHAPDTGWDEAELAEQRRRSEHERIMMRLFGASFFRSAAMNVEQIRDPRNNLEQIAFSIVPREREFG